LNAHSYVTVDSHEQVFIRELISNASDALEKLKYRQLTGKLPHDQLIDPDLPLEIRISVDEDKKILTIQDTGIGMLKEELIEDLGRTGRSGTVRSPILSPYCSLQSC
jgi:HSP90 family molecular chaperone